MGEAVAVAGLPDVSDRRPAMVGGLEDDVDHPGDGVRTVLCRSAVAQHLDPLDGVDRDGVQVDAGGALLQPPLILRLAVSWRRLPFTSTSTWLGLSPRSDCVWVNAEALNGWAWRVSEGSSLTSASRRSTAPLLRSWVALTTSIGLRLSWTLTSFLRVPVTTTVDKVGAGAAPVSPVQALVRGAGRRRRFRPARMPARCRPAHAARRPRH